MKRYPQMMLGVFGVTLFASATLLFLVQPMIGKLTTPLLGGTPAVWNTCMVFFQAALLAGYAYAHGTTAWLGARRQAVLHLGILVLPFFFFPLSVNEELIRGSEENPVPALLLLLVMSVGVPFFVVSTSAPLLQKWFASTSHPAARDPYFLYASSNLGSMLALVGYPLAYEYFVPLSSQKWVWAAGYAVLVLLVGGCAVLLWLSPSAKTEADVKAADAEEKFATVLQPMAANQQAVSRQRGRGRRKVGRSDAVTEAPAKTTAELGRTPVTKEITWLRRLRWVLLAAIPSSLMLGVTTYMTTDIAAISYLWLPPLTLYLLTFIIVFARVPPLVHRVMVLLLPLVVLLLVFMMLSDLRPEGIEYSIAIHLFTLFIVAMVCHGELAKDRPGPQALTEFFLWMSVGGVLGGIFNGLVAPVVFIGNIEYPLALVAACLILPGMGWDRDFGKWGTYADIGVAAFCTLAGLGLLWLRLLDHDLSINPTLLPATVIWSAVGIALALGWGLFRIWRARTRRLAAGFDLLLPFSLVILVIGLLWGLPCRAIKPGFIDLAQGMDVRPVLLRMLVTFAVPAVICYTFVERSLRFGLGVGALLLAGAIGNLSDFSVLFQTRSFFGILRVEVKVELPDIYASLIHGTTLHGTQIQPGSLNYEDYKAWPITYYSLYGPVGYLFKTYSPAHVNALGAAAGAPATTLRLPGVRPNLGVIGLGTGSMACYAEKGQQITFFDIDPAIRDISFGADGWFSYVEDARKRGAIVEDLVLGDARLTLQRMKLAEHEKYGILIVDAFSSDAIPIHLINQSALRLYLSKVTEHGIIAFHVSNRHLNLLPVLANLAEAEEIAGVYMQNPADEEIHKTSTTWVLLARKPEYLEGRLQEVTLEEQVAASEVEPGWKDLKSQRDSKVGVWTDDYSNLLSVFRW